MKMLHYAFVLSIICLVCTLGVAGTFAITRERIQAVEREDRARAQSAVIPAPSGAKLQFKAANPSAPEAAQIFEASDESGRVLGYAAVGSAQGYGGPVRVMLGMDPAGEKIVGLVVISQNETPGLGTRVVEIKSKKTWFAVLTGSSKAEAEETVPEFLKQFFGKKPDELLLGKTIQGITGATISSKAVVAATRDASEKIRKVISSAKAQGAGAGEPARSADERGASGGG